jgi:phage baseplate assembly protein gpV
MAGVAAATPIAMSGRALASESTDDINFDRQVNIVEQYGADNTGSSAIDGELDQAISDGTLVVFPEGTYKVTQSHVLPGGATVGFRGEGDVTFVPRTGSNHFTLVSSVSSPVDEALFKNIDYDIRADDTTAGMKFNTRNGFHVEDVEYIGRGTHPSSEVVSALTVTIRNPDAVGTIKRLVAKKGSMWARYKGGDGRTGIGVYQPNKGTVRVVDCHLEEFGNNAMYTSRHDGNVQVSGGFFRNNNVAGTRIGGDGSWVDGATYVIDPAAYTGAREPAYEDHAFGMRAVRIEQRKFDKPAGAEIRNCEMIVKPNPGTHYAVQVKDNAKSVNITDSRIHYEPDGIPAIGKSANGHPIQMENVSITGDAEGGCAVRARDAPGSAVRNCCIHETGNDRDGIDISGDNSTVTDTNVNVDGEAISLSGSNTSTSGITRDGECSGNPNSTDSYEHTLTVESDGPEVYYELSVSGDLRKSSTMDATVDGDDTAWAASAEGTVGSDRDSYDYNGEVTDFYADGDVTVYIDGEAIDPGSLPGPSLDHTLTVEGPGAGEYVPYEFSVAGDLYKSTAMGATVDDNDTIDGRTASGAVGGGRDSFAYGDGVTSFATDGEVTLYRDGETVTVDELTGELTHTIEISSTAEDRAFYEFTVSGDLEYGDGANPDAEYPDEVNGSTGSGSVALYGTDDFQFSGELETVTVDGPAEVTVDGESVSAERLQTHRIEISSTAEDRAFYEFSVTGRLEFGDGANPDAEYPDEVNGSTGSGSVALYGTDDFQFSGELETVTVDGPAEVTVDGEVVEQ